MAHRGHSSKKRRRKWSGTNQGSNDLSKKSPAALSSLQSQRRALPIYSSRQKIVDTLRATKTGVLIIVGATGSGKSTQLPQYLLDILPADEQNPIIRRRQCVAVTQPRRVAAMTVAKRVAAERNVTLGKDVGYAVRFDDCSGPDTRIRFMTDGLLLREAMVDKHMKKYKVIVLDEAHERSLHTDILLGLLKGLLHNHRSDLRLVVMSATLNAQAFSTFFDGAPVLRVPGRQHMVKMMYACESQPDYVDAIINTVLQIHVDAASAQGDILAFLTGQEEIENVAAILERRIKELLQDAQQGGAVAPFLRLVVCPMFAALPAAQQMLAFGPTPPNHRKVVLATNIAESSVTIPGIRYVVDPGLAKQRAYRAKTGIECLLVSPISQEQAWQRSGRAGREAPGTCYRLYTEVSFETALRPVAIPEVQRCNLSTVILQLKAAGVADITAFDYMEPPSMSAVKRALQQLFVLGALRATDGGLTTLGRHMAALPLAPEYAKLLLESRKAPFHCTAMALTLVAMLSVDSVLFYPKDKREEAAAAHGRFAVPDSDHETLVHVYGAFEEAQRNREWCHKHFLNARSLMLAARIRGQLVEILTRALRRDGASVSASAMEHQEAEDGEQQQRLRQCLAASCFLQSARLEPAVTKGARRQYRTMVTSQSVSIHPSSVLFRRTPQCVLFNELILTVRPYMRCVTSIPLEWLMEFSPQCFGKEKKISRT